jgi:hypothetical protein
LDLDNVDILPLQEPPNSDYRIIELEEGAIGDTTNEADDEESDSDGDVPFYVSLPLGDLICKFWDLRRKNLASDFAISGWFLCVQNEAMEDVAASNGIMMRW